MKFSDETIETMKSPVAKIAALVLVASTLVLAVQALLRVF
jgi:hypothetical protein